MPSIASKMQNLVTRTISTSWKGVGERPTRAWRSKNPPAHALPRRDESIVASESCLAWEEDEDREPRTDLLLLGILLGSFFPFRRLGRLSRGLGLSSFPRCGFCLTSLAGSLLAVNLPTTFLTHVAQELISESLREEGEMPF